MWVRDKNSDWKNELEGGVMPQKIENASIILPGNIKVASVDVYDPWMNKWTAATVTENRVQLPEFKRSLVVRLRHGR